MEYKEILPILTRVVREVGEKYLETAHELEKTKKTDGSFVTQVDVAIDQTLKEKLNEQFPNISFISEELQSDTTQVQGLVWCIDPIDGTHNFMNGIPYYAISVGLLLDGEPLLGAIYDPTTQNLLSGGRDMGIFMNSEPFETVNNSMIIVSGRSHTLEDKKREQAVVNSIFEGELKYRRFCSLALDIMNLVCGKIGAVRVINNSMWDWAAGYVLAQEAGYTIDHYDTANFIIYDSKLSEHVSMLK